MARKFAVLFILIFYGCSVCISGVCEGIPDIYMESFLDASIRQTITIGGYLNVTVLQADLVDFTELYDGHESGGQGTQHVLVIDLLLENTGETIIDGSEYVQGAMPLVFNYPLSIEDEQSSKAFDLWGRWDSMMDFFSKNERYGANTQEYNIRVYEEGKDWYELIELSNVQIMPGDSIQVRDIRGSVSPDTIQYFKWPIGYEVTHNGDRARILAIEFIINFNDPDCYIGNQFSQIDLLLKGPMITDDDLFTKYAKRWGELKDREMYLELTRAWQEEFDMEVTGVLDQDLLNHLIHYSNTH